MTTYAGEVRIKTRLDANGINEGFNKATAVLGKLAVAVGAAFSVQAIINFSKVSLEAAAKSELAWSGLKFVLNANNRSFAQAKGFLQDFTSDGLVPLTDAIKAYQNMVMRGYDTGQIEDMLTVMKDAAAFGRQGQYSMGEAIEKSTQGLRMENSLLTDSVGIQTNVAKMWEAYAKEIGTTANRLTHAQKLQAEYNGFMKEGGIFAGAAAQYANTYSGRISQLTTAFYNLKTAVGNAIIPILNRILPAIVNVFNWFTRLFNIVGRVMNLLFGTNVGMADTADGARDAADGTGEMADNLERANKAAKGSLASFDKLNVLTQAEEGGESGAGSEVLPIDTPDTEPFEQELDELSAKIEEFKERLRTIFDLIKTGDFSTLGQALSNGILGALGKMRQAVQGFDFKQLGIDIGSGFNNVISSISSFIKNIDFKEIGKQVGGLVSDALKGALDTAIGFLQTVDWQKVGTTIWEGILSAIDFMKGRLSGFDWSGVVSRIFELLGSAIGAAAALIVGLGTAIWESLKEAWNTVKEKWAEFKDEAGGDIWGGLKEGIVNAIKNVGEWIKEKVVQPFIDGVKKGFGIASPSTVMAEIGGYLIDGLLEGIKAAWTNFSTWFDTTILQPLKNWFSEAWADITEWATTTWNDIKFAWEGAGTWFNESVLIPIQTFFTEKWDAISAKVTGIWEDIKTAWQTAKDWFNETVLDPISNAFTSVWRGISDTIKNIINGIIGFVNGMIQGIVNGVNSVIGVLNGFSFTIPDWVPGLGGRSVGFNISTLTAPQIPYLATGAVIPPNAPFAAILGDQRHGTNIEAPENLIRQIMREEMQGMNTQPQTIHNVLKLDGRVVYESWDRENRRVGGSMISKGAMA